MEAREQDNLEYARRWLHRSRMDFAAFKKLVPFDRKGRENLRCSDPALAVYLLQQSVEKAIKAIAIASGQYRAKNFTNYYQHNSFGLILNFCQKAIGKADRLRLVPLADMMGIDLRAGSLNLEIWPKSGMA